MRSIALILAVTLAACADDTTDKSEDTDTTGSTDTTGDSDTLTATDTTVETDVDTDLTDEVIALYTVSGTVSGLTGDGLTLALNDGAPFSIAADGSFTFTEEVQQDDAYVVTVASAPSCPLQDCVIAQGDGIATGHVSDVTVTCGEPMLTMLSANWGSTQSGESRGLRFVDDVLSYADDDVATVRKVEGDNVPFPTPFTTESVAVDVAHDTAYFSTTTRIYRYTNLPSIVGDTAPTGSFSISDTTLIESVCVDASRDRLYVLTHDNLRIFNGASALSGDDLVPDAVVPLTDDNDLEGCDFDAMNDRLYVNAGGDRTLQIFDNASTLTSASTPSRTATWTTTDGPSRIWDVEIDACNDRLYLGTNVPSPSGAKLFAFNNASTLSGVLNFDASAARISGVETLSISLDPLGNLWVFEDSATDAWKFESPDLWSGDVSNPTPDVTIQDVTFKSYGMEVYAP